MSHVKYLILGIFVSVTMPITGNAGPYTDDLSKCLVASTTVQDRNDLVRWMFSAAAFHPAVRSIASVSKEQLEEANINTAKLFTKLLTESCRKQTIHALQYEGESTVQASFQVLGSVAGKELFASPEVTNAIAGMNKYLDKEKFASLAPQK
jgi:hypothetical protein